MNIASRRFNGLKTFKLISLPKPLNLKLLNLIAILIAMTSCNTDELCYQHPHVGDFVVKYDWSRCPDAQPRSMAAYFYPVSGESGHIDYNFAGRDGGNAHLLCGTYLALSLNSDHQDWARMRNEHDIDLFEVYTSDALTLEALGIDVKNLPTARTDTPERMAHTPGGRLFNHRLDEIEITSMPSTVTFTPQEATCHYTVTITGVENIKYLHGGQIDGTLTGLAEGFLHGSHSPSDVPVTMPFVLTPNTSEATMKAQFLTLGRCSGTPRSNILTVYVVFDDGSAGYYTYDVTNQVAEAPDPYNVDITIHGLVLPKPIANGSGFKPAINDWQNVTEDIIM